MFARLFQSTEPSPAPRGGDLLAQVDAAAAAETACTVLLGEPQTVVRGLLHGSGRKSLALRLDAAGSLPVGHAVLVSLMSGGRLLAFYTRVLHSKGPELTLERPEQAIGLSPRRSFRVPVAGLGVLCSSPQRGLVELVDLSSTGAGLRMDEAPVVLSLQLAFGGRSVQVLAHPVARHADGVLGVAFDLDDAEVAADLRELVRLVERAWVVRERALD